MAISRLRRIMIAFFDYVGPKMPKSEYANYKKMLTQSENIFNKTASTKFLFVPTTNRIANLYGGASEETLSALRSSDFINTVVKKFKDKGYRVPEEALSIEALIPHWSGVGATTINGKSLLYSPRSINRLNPRCVFHEMGHILDYNQQRNSYIINFLSKKDKYFKFLTNEESAIFKADIARATEEGYFRGMPFKQWLQDKYFAFGKIKNSDIKRYKKNAAEINSRYPLTDRFEFLADMFSLKVQGFKFSSDIESKYKQFGGPKVHEIFSKEEVNELLKLQKQIRKKTLSDYGITVIS